MIWPDCHGQSLKKIGSQQLLQDLVIIKKSVEDVHPGMNRFGQQAGFVSRYDSISHVLSGRDSMMALEFFRAVNPLLASVRCGHVKFLPPVKDFPFYFHPDHVFPLILRFDEKNRLLIVNTENDRLKGKYLEKINDMPITDILHVLRDNMFVDGNVQSSADAQIQQYFSAWYADFIQDSDSFIVGLSDDSGKNEEVMLDGISVASWQEMDKKIGFLEKNKTLVFKNDSVAYLRIPVFYGKSNKQFLEFLDKSFEEIERRKPKKLIVDVRGNEGGNDVLGKELYAYIARKDFKYYDRIELRVKKRKHITYRKLAYFPRFIGLATLFIKRKDGKLLWTHHENRGSHKPKKCGFKGEVVFLMDGLSYSVTSEFLAVARNEQRGQFVGQESGGTYEGDNSGTFVIFKLPATGIDVGIPVAGYYSAVKPETESGRGIIPDIEIKPTAADLLNNRDAVLLEILKK